MKEINGKPSHRGQSNLEAQPPSDLEKIPAFSQPAIDGAPAVSHFSKLLLDTLFGEGGLGDVLNHLVADIAKHLGARMVCLGVHCKEENLLSLEAFHLTKDLSEVSKKLRPYWPRPTTPPGLLWRELLRTRQPLIITNAASDPRAPFLDLLLVVGPARLLVIPVSDGNEPVGFLAVADPTAGATVAESVNLPKDLAQRTLLGVKLAILANTARYLAVLGERSRMAGDLHDIVARGFTGIMLQLGLAEQIIPADQKEALSRIARARRFASESLAEARRAVYALKLRTPATQPLSQSLQHVAAEITADTGIRARFLSQGKEPVLTEEAATQLLLIAQEAVTNILRHARSSRVWIKLCCSSRHVRLVIQDDGSGFVSSSAGAGRGMGLKNMERRAQVAGGCLTISSRPGGGTEVRVTIPGAASRRLGRNAGAEIAIPEKPTPAKSA